MSGTNNKTGILHWLHPFFGAVLLLTFFLSWVSWDGTTVSGSAMATGDFFKISETRFRLANPFPQLSFSLYIFWLIPVMAAISVSLFFLKKRTTIFSFMAGALSLALLVVYYLFTNTLIDLGVGKNAFSMLKPAAYLHGVAAAGLILTSFSTKSVLPKLFWLLTGPVLAYGSYKMGEKYIMKETHKATEDVKADYTISAPELITEFIKNDTASNKKYHEKMMVITGPAAAVEILPDSTSTIKFADSTGSYAIFSFEKNMYEKASAVKQGDQVSLKGVCSGSIYSEILGTTAITFKRATFNSNK